MTLIANNFKSLKIKGVDDVDGYELAKEGARELQKARTQLTNLAKSERQGAIDYQRGIISLEKDLLSIVVPIRISLKEQTDGIDRFKESEYTVFKKVNSIIL